MNRMLYTIFIAFSLLIRNYESLPVTEQATLPSQIKVIDTKIWYYNPNYFNGMNFNITPANDTYNKVELSWSVSQDISDELHLMTNVFAYDNDGRPAKLIFSNIMPVCKHSQQGKYLPHTMIARDFKINSECITKGLYDIENMGQLRFDLLVPDIEQKGKYYTVHYIFETPTEILLAVSFYSKWGHLQDESD